jgi:HEAT repeat protein
MVSFLQMRHIAGSQFNLTSLLLEPRLVPAPGPIQVRSAEDTVTRDVFEVIPRFHDMPQSFAPFNVETFSLDDLGAGDRHVAILGVSGIGKSTALATLALMAFGEVAFESLEDITQKAIEEEEKSMTKEEREQRAKERERIQERALEKLHDAHERQREQLKRETEFEKLPILDIRTLLPIFIDLGSIDLDADTVKNKEGLVDPAEILVRGVQRQVSAVTSQVVGSVIYPVLEAGRALVLIDGYDELTPDMRERYYPWLNNFLAIYGHNMVVIAGPVEGFEPLHTLGFTPIYLRPWREDDYETLARRWSAAWTTQGKGKQQVRPPDEQTMRQITVDNRGRSMFDVTLKIWTGLADDTRVPGRMGWYDAYVNRLLANEDMRPLLPNLAARMLECNLQADQAQLIDVLTQTLPAPADPKKPGPKPEDLLGGVIREGLLSVDANGTLHFPHLQITGYLASEFLAQAGPSLAAEHALDPVWQDALSFASARINVLPVIQRKLASTPDLIYSNLFGLIHWLPDAPPDASWRGDLFKRLGAALLAADQYPGVRARAMAALIASREKQVLFILRQALRSTDAYTRQLACVGLGALGNPEAIRDLEPMLGDENRDVQLAAGLSLGAIGTEKALEVMVYGLLHGTDELRRAVAEALAAIPGEGHAILRDGIESEDILIRRATVFGLSRMKSPWALVALYRAMIEDSQWYVRNAAEEAFIMAQSPEGDGPRAHPEADSLVWLVQWATEHGQGVPAGENSRQVLIRALQEGDPAHKVLAAQTLGRLGHVPALKPLYGALRDRSPEVRGAAYGALAEIQVRVGKPLPGLA